MSVEGKHTPLPCPFCGGDGEISYYATASSPEPAGYFVECATCAAAGPNFAIQGEMPDRVEYTQARAVDGWNTRVPVNSYYELLEALRMLRDYVGDTASGALTYEGGGEGLIAMAKEDLARIDAAISKATMGEGGEG